MRNAHAHIIDGRSSILHYGPLIETKNLYVPEAETKEILP